MKNTNVKKGIKRSVKKFATLTLATALVVGSLAGTPATSEAAKKTELNKKKVTLKVGKTVMLKVKNAPKGKKIKWTSKKPKIAKVNKKGKVTALKVGKTKIIAKVGKKKYKCKVTVKAADTAATTTPATTAAVAAKTAAPATKPAVNPTATVPTTQSPSETTAPEVPVETSSPEDLENLAIVTKALGNTNLSNIDCYEFSGYKMFLDAYLSPGDEDSEIKAEIQVNSEAVSYEFITSALTNYDVYDSATMKNASVMGAVHPDGTEDESSRPVVLVSNNDDVDYAYNAAISRCDSYFNQLKSFVPTLKNPRFEEPDTLDDGDVKYVCKDYDLSNFGVDIPGGYVYVEAMVEPAGTLESLFVSIRSDVDEALIIPVISYVLVKYDIDEDMELQFAESYEAKKDSIYGVDWLVFIYGDDTSTILNQGFTKDVYLTYALKDGEKLYTDSTFETEDTEGGSKYNSIEDADEDDSEYVRYISASPSSADYYKVSEAFNKSTSYYSVTNTFEKAVFTYIDFTESIENEDMSYDKSLSVVCDRKGLSSEYDSKQKIIDPETGEKVDSIYHGDEYCNVEESEYISAYYEDEKNIDFDNDILTKYILDPDYGYDYIANEYNSNITLNTNFSLGDLKDYECVSKAEAKEIENGTEYVFEKSAKDVENLPVEYEDGDVLRYTFTVGSDGYLYGFDYGIINTNDETKLVEILAAGWSFDSEEYSVKKSDVLESLASEFNGTDFTANLNIGDNSINTVSASKNVEIAYERKDRGERDFEPLYNDPEFKEECTGADLIISYDSLPEDNKTVTKYLKRLLEKYNPGEEA